MSVAGPKNFGLPAEGFEPPTFGLQNRCTTTVLTRHFNDLEPSELNGLDECVQLLFPTFSNLSMPPLANRSSGRTQTATTDRVFWPVRARISSSVQLAAPRAVLAIPIKHLER